MIYILKKDILSIYCNIIWFTESRSKIERSILNSSEVPITIIYFDCITNVLHVYIWQHSKILVDNIDRKWKHNLNEAANKGNLSRAQTDVFKTQSNISDGAFY